MSLVSLDRFFVIPTIRRNSKNIIPPGRLDETFLSYALPLVMFPQARYIRARVFSQGQNEFAVRETLIQLPVNQEPRPVFERLVPLRFRQNIRQVALPRLSGQVHVERSMLVPELFEALGQCFGPCFRQTDSKDLSPACWSQPSQPADDSQRRHKDATRNATREPTRQTREPATASVARRAALRDSGPAWRPPSTASNISA